MLIQLAAFGLLLGPSRHVEKSQLQRMAAQAATPLCICRALPVWMMADDFVKMGDALQVELDCGDDDGPEELVWAAATVSKIDAETGSFSVMVTEFADLPADDPEQEDAYEEGPYFSAGEGDVWRRATSVGGASGASMPAKAVADTLIGLLDDEVKSPPLQVSIADLPPALTGAEAYARGALETAEGGAQSLYLRLRLRQEELQ